ncbi:MAG: SpoIIE family protein phosphatase [Bacteroidia bacterium]
MLLKQVKNFLFTVLLLNGSWLLAQKTSLKEFDVFLGDTINKVDKDGLKQGRWVFFGKDQRGLKNKILKHNQITEEGQYLNDKKNGTWKSYHTNTNKLKRELVYANGVTAGKAKFYTEKGKLKEEGVLQNNKWVGEYSYYDEKGNKYTKNAPHNNVLTNSYLSFSGVVSRNGRPLEDVKILVEKNELEYEEVITTFNGAFTISLELNNDYVLRFSKTGCTKQSLLVNTDVDSFTDTTVYELKDWKVDLYDNNIAAAATNEFFGFLLNKPSGKIYFNSRKKRFISDGSYAHLFKKQLNDISETTKILLATAAEDNKKLEIEKLRVESENKLKEIELLRKNKELQDAELNRQQSELLAQKLEAERKEQNLALLEKEKQLKELRFKQQEAELVKQQLEAERKAREIEKLSMSKKLQEIAMKEQKETLSKTESELSQKQKEASIKEKEIGLLNKEKEVQQKELKQKQTVISIVLVGLGLILVFAFFLYRNIMQKKKANIILAKQAEEITRQHEELEEKSRMIEEKNIETEQSILYAKRIQHAILPPPHEIDPFLDNYFILYKSKDIVSGDFYFFSDKYAKIDKDPSVIFAAVDCTGHGVPGAFMSLVGCEKLKDAVDISAEPGRILKELNIGVKGALRQSGENATSTRDGMDLSLCAIPVGKKDSAETTIKYAGANRPLWIIKNGSKELIEYKATKCAIGGLTEDSQEFEQNDITLGKGDIFYLFSDGFADQFGGANKKKLMTKKFKEILVEISHQPMHEQRQYLDDFIEEWKGDVEHIDEILVIGVRV